MLEVIKQAALDSVEAARPVKFWVARVLSPPPDIRIRLRNEAKLEIPSELILVSEHLCRHTRTATLQNGQVSTTMTRQEDHTHDLTSLAWNESDVMFEQTLQKGDQVMVAAIQGGQSFFIFDRVVTQYANDDT